MSEALRNLPADVKEAADRLMRAVCETDCYREYLRLRKEAFATAENRSLLRRYGALQWELRTLPAGIEPDEELRHEFEKINLVAFDDPTVSDYLLSKLRLETMTGAVAEQIMRLSTDPGDEEA